MNNQRVQIFLLNGPPYSGKDSLARAVISGDRTFGKMEFAFPIKQANQALFGLSDNHIALYESNKDEKEMRRPELLGRSWREINIALPERFVKKEYGSEAFGQFFVNRLRAIRVPKTGMNVIVSDNGFTDEVIPVIKAYGPDNVHIIKIGRKGCSYKGDSRSYVDAKKLGVREYFIRNDKKEMDYLTQGFRLIQAIKAGNYPNTTPFSDEIEEKSPEKKSDKK